MEFGLKWTFPDPAAVYPDDEEMMEPLLLESGDGGGVDGM